MQVSQVCYMLEANMFAMPLLRLPFLKHDSHLSTMRNVFSSQNTFFCVCAKLVDSIGETTLQQGLLFSPKPIFKWLEKEFRYYPVLRKCKNGTTLEESNDPFLTKRF